MESTSRHDAKSQIILATLFLAGCTPHITIPAIPLIDEITLTDNSTHRVTTITDPKKIAAILSFLNARHTGCYAPSSTFPTPAFDATFESSGELQFVIWISSPSANWIGFRPKGKAAPDNLLRDITTAERGDLLRMLGKS